MEHANSVWSNLDMRRRLIVIAASIAVFAAILFMARSTTSQDLALLYAGLDESTAGGVISALDQEGVIYDVRGSSIFVPAAQRDRLRMTLAGQGLPANSTQGYELLDTLSGFGTTSQMFDAAYWRAKEGELARTILASPHIRAARVHISANSAQPFRREQAPTAAVTVTTINGYLDENQADALRFLVASAVPGLATTDVAVIDGVGGLIAGQADSPVAADTADRVAELRARVERLLEARVGPGNAVVEVSIDTITETETIVERRFDPEARVAISTEVQESNASSEGNATGDVTVASNLPDGDAAGNGGAVSNENSESRTVTNFEVSETQREILRSPGAVRRLSVAVLVNGVDGTDAEGQPVQVPRSEEELEDLRLLVASAVGFEAERGDEITIRSMAFENVPILGTEAGDPLPTSGEPLDLMKLAQLGVLGLVALILGLFVVRPILTSNKASPPLLDNSGSGLGPVVVGSGDTMIDGVSAQTGSGAAQPGAATKASDENVDPVERLRDLIEDRRDEAIQVLQAWIDEPASDPGK